jgi:hypothetical protein
MGGSLCICKRHDGVEDLPKDVAQYHKLMAQALTLVPMNGYAWGDSAPNLRLSCRSARTVVDDARQHASRLRWTGGPIIPLLPSGMAERCPNVVSLDLSWSRIKDFNPLRQAFAHEPSRWVGMRVWVITWHSFITAIHVHVCHLVEHRHGQCHHRWYAQL